MTRAAALLALLLALAFPAQAQQLCRHPVNDAGVQTACNTCNDGWSGLLTLAMPLDGILFAKTAGIESKSAIPLLAAMDVTYLGVEAGLRALAGEKRPFEHWVVILVTRSLASMLTYVAGQQLSTAPAVLASIGITAAAAIPLFVLEPEEL